MTHFGFTVDPAAARKLIADYKTGKLQVEL